MARKPKRKPRRPLRAKQPFPQLQGHQDRLPVPVPALSPRRRHQLLPLHRPHHQKSLEQPLRLLFGGPLFASFG